MSEAVSGGHCVTFQSFLFKAGRGTCDVEPALSHRAAAAVCVFGAVELPFFIRVMARGLVSLPD